MADPSSTWAKPGFSSIATDPLRNFRFLLQISPNPGSKLVPTSAKWNAYLGFTSVSGLAMQIDSIPYREGGYNTTVHQLPGQATFSPITLSRGVTVGTSQNYNWTRTLFSTISGNGISTSGSNFRATVVIRVLEHPVTNSGANPFPKTKLDFTIYNAWISSLAYSDLNAGDNALLVEQMTLVHEGFTVNYR